MSLNTWDLRENGSNYGIGLTYLVAEPTNKRRNYFLKLTKL